MTCTFFKRRLNCAFARSSAIAFLSRQRILRRRAISRERRGARHSIDSFHSICLPYFNFA